MNRRMALLTADADSANANLQILREARMVDLGGLTRSSTWFNIINPFHTHLYPLEDLGRCTVEETIDQLES